MLTADNVNKIFEDCLFKKNEVKDGKPVIEPVVGEGIINTFGFYPERLESHKAEVTEMLKDLPDQFMQSKGGGWSFLNACVTKDEIQWGEHRSMEQLFALAIALKLAAYTLPRDMWNILPGGMPYVVVKDEEMKERKKRNENL